LLDLALLRPFKQALKAHLVDAVFRRADGFIASFPKSGRTWVRFILANYLNEVFGLGVDVDLKTLFQIIPNDRLDRERGRLAYRFARHPQMPLLVASHLPFRPQLFRDRKVLFMVREPKDVLVSWYFHKTRHGGGYDGCLKTFLRDPTVGLEAWIGYTNSWARHLAGRPHLLLSYEALRAAPEAVIRLAVRFFDLPLDDGAIARAVAASSFERMQALERARGIAGQVGGARRAEPEALRVRRGRIGGHLEHLEPEDAQLINAGCLFRLDPAARRLLGRAGIPLDLELMPAAAPARAASA
jgi:hypothetical protein